MKPDLGTTQNNTNQKGRDYPLDLLRILSAFGVVILHVSADRWFQASVFTDSWGAMSFFNALTRWAVPMFFMMSGRLHLDPSREILTSKVFSYKIPRIALITGFWSLFYLASDLIARQFLTTEGVQWKHLVDKLEILLVGPAAPHLWFLPALLVLYFLTPYLRKLWIPLNRSSASLLLALLLALVSLLPSLSFVFQLFGIDGVLQGWILPGVLIYPIFFMLGSYIHRFPLGTRTKTILLLVGILCLIGVHLGTLDLSRTQGSPVESLHHAHLIWVVVPALGLFTLAPSAGDSRLNKDERAESVKTLNNTKPQRKLLVFLSRGTLGVYLIHVFWIDLLRFFRLTSLSANTWIMIPILSILVLLLSYTMTWILMRIPFVARWLI